MRWWHKAIVVYAVVGMGAPMLPSGCSSTEDCQAAGDEDGNGVEGCDDPACWVAGGGCTERCNTVADEDGDGLVACADDDCWSADSGCPEDCESGGDEDGDGSDGCDDSDCWTADNDCPEQCDSENDEDADGLVSCADDDCWTAESGCPEDCDTDDDEDGDGASACDDSDCDSAPACAPGYAEDVRPIFLEHCYGNSGECHSDASALGGLSVDDYDTMLLDSLYCPGMTKGACSLFRILEPSMPEDCLGCVPDAEVAVVQLWVDTGLLP